MRDRGWSRELFVAVLVASDTHFVETTFTTLHCNKYIIRRKGSRHRTHSSDLFKGPTMSWPSLHRLCWPVNGTQSRYPPRVEVRSANRTRGNRGRKADQSSFFKRSGILSSREPTTLVHEEPPRRNVVEDDSRRVNQQVTLMK
jgi:hypothetical protein